MQSGWDGYSLSTSNVDGCSPTSRRMLRSRIHVDAENTQQQRTHAHKTPSLKQSLHGQQRQVSAKPERQLGEFPYQPSVAFTECITGKSLTTAVNRTLLRDKTNTGQSREVPKTPTNLKKAQFLQTPLPSLSLLKTPSPNPLRRKLLSPTPVKDVHVVEEPEPVLEIDWSERQVECATESAIGLSSRFVLGIAEYCTDEPYVPEGLTDWRTTTVLDAIRSIPIYVDGWDEAIDPADDPKFELIPWEECQVVRGRLCSSVFKAMLIDIQMRLSLLSTKFSKRLARHWVKQSNLSNVLLL